MRAFNLLCFITSGLFTLSTVESAPVRPTDTFVPPRNPQQNRFHYVVGFIRNVRQIFEPENPPLNEETLRPQERFLDHNNIAAPRNDFEEHNNHTEDGPIPIAPPMTRILDANNVAAPTDDLMERNQTRDGPFAEVNHALRNNENATGHRRNHLQNPAQGNILRPRERFLDHNNIAAPTNDLEEYYNQTEDGPIPIARRLTRILDANNVAAPTDDLMEQNQTRDGPFAEVNYDQRNHENSTENRTNSLQNQMQVGNDQNTPSEFSRHSFNGHIILAPRSDQAHSNDTNQRAFARIDYRRSGIRHHGQHPTSDEDGDQI